MPDLFLHNPSCSKSRAALALVRDAGIELPIREYLQDPLSVDELRRIVELLGVRPIDIVRRGEPQCAALGLDAAHPRRRHAARDRRASDPSRAADRRSRGAAVVGRPPEAVRDIL